MKVFLHLAPIKFETISKRQKHVDDNVHLFQVYFAAYLARSPSLRHIFDTRKAKESLQVCYFLTLIKTRISWY